MKLLVQDMTCSGCVRGVTTAIKTRDPQAVVNVDLESKQVDVQTTEAAEAIIQALDEAGFPARQSA